jgi:sulfate permease, SulP family
LPRGSGATTPPGQAGHTGTASGTGTGTNDLPDHGPGAEPGNLRLRPGQAVRAWVRGIRPRRADLKADALAGLPGAISSVPDGMATAVLVGVNPAFGLYASFAGKIGGGLATSTTMMIVTTTTAASLAAGSALEGFGADERAGALVLLTMLTGVVMIAAGVLRLGRYIRFVSRSVMLGFLTGVSVNIVFGQLPDLLGVNTSGGSRVRRPGTSSPTRGR